MVLTRFLLGDSRQKRRGFVRSQRSALPEGSFLAFDPPGGRVKVVSRLMVFCQKLHDLHAGG